MSNSTPDAPRETPLGGLAKHSLVYSLAPLIQRFLALGLTRLWTDKLDPARMGVANTLDLLFIALIQISGTNVLAGVVRFYFDQKDERDRKAVVSSAIVFLSAVSWSLVGLCLIFRTPLTEFFFDAADPRLKSDNLVYCLVVTLLTIPLALSSDAAFRYLQIQQKSGLISTLRVSKACFEMVLRVLFLVVFEWGVVGFLLATLVGELLTNLLLTSWVLRRTGLRFSWRVLRPMLVYAAPLVAVGLCQMGLNQIDRLMLGQLGPRGTDMGLVGIYSQGYMIGFLVQTVVVGSFMQIWQPWIFGVREEARRRELVTRVSTWALFVVGCISIGVICFGRELVWLLTSPTNPQYREAFRVVPWVCAGYVFFAFNGLAQVPMFIAKRTWPMLWVNLIALAVNVGLNFLLIPRYGFVGSAIATTVTFMVLGVLGHVVAVQVVAARFEHGRMVAMLALVLAVMAATLWVDAEYSQRYASLLTPITSLKAIAILAVLGVVWLWFLHADERAQLFEKVRARLR